ncbi:MAG: MarC family protein [Pseudomonadota bacterium]
METFVKSAWLLFLLLNPFLMSIYLMALIRDLNRQTFSLVMQRAHLVSFGVFGSFAVLGDRLFTQVFNVRFASFLIFGGIVFLLIGVRSVFSGTLALLETRGAPAHLAGAVAMPFMIGPGTVSAAVFAGAQQPWPLALAAVATALIASYVAIVLFKRLLDSARKRDESLVQGYIEVTGRIVALFTGTYAIEMILRGAEIIARDFSA